MPQVAYYPPAIYRTRRPYRQRALTQPLREQLKQGVEQSQEMSRSLTLESEFAAIERELNATSNLQNGWDSYGAERPGTDPIRNASGLLRELKVKQFLPTRIVPSAEGGVALYFMDKDRICYIEYRNSGDTILAMYRPADEPEIRELRSGADVLASIDAVRAYLA